MAGVLQRLPGELQQQALLRVHAGRLARRDAEELGVEAIDVVDEAAFERVHPPGRIGVGVEPGIAVPALGRYRTDRVAPGEQQILEGSRIDDAARRPDRQPYDRDRFGRCSFMGRNPCLQVADLGQGPFDDRQVRRRFCRMRHAYCSMLRPVRESVRGVRRPR